MPLLTRSQILAAQLPHQDVEVPEFGPGSVVRVQQMSVQTRIDYLERIRKERQAVSDWEEDQALPAKTRKGVAQPAPFDQAALALVLCVVNEDGDPEFTDADMAALATRSQNAVTRIWTAVQEINWYDRTYSDQVEAEKKD